MPDNKVLIIDYGSQVTQLIARRVREAGVYSEVLPSWTTAQEIKSRDPGAIILSGGPASVTDPGAPGLNPTVLELGVPILGICYGLQLLTHHLGGRLARSEDREYGPTQLEITAPSPLWKDLPRFARVWMSHGDKVDMPPPGFTVTATTPNLAVAALACEARRLYGVQFHPEVHHTKIGPGLIRNFLNLAGLKADWNMTSFVKHTLVNLKTKIGNGQVICGLSGGIDSTVTAILLHQAIGKQLHCLFVDNGLLRQGETDEVRKLADHFRLDFTVAAAAKLFLNRLKEVVDPEQKRKIIGRTFIEVFEAEAAQFGQVDFLAQGTLYPDVIESVSPQGPAAVIKSHHNVGGLPDDMNLTLIEPLRDLFKDEVRAVAAELDLPENFIWRQPFPGPGLAIRVIGAVDDERLTILRQADVIVQQELKETGLYRHIWQGFAVLLPLKTVGVMGDGRTYENIVAIRAVESVDAMTADWARLPYDFLATLSRRIINEVQGVNRVVYDISSKPPSTIEWE
ncbi:MAG: GMP synthase [Candidatus Adiutrix intracellularis]|jgi:GMP synthase (glutamine-hydrolysing)|nr:MAG: GMP synthase [Candidatus Adiutrix intracellularis]MDR2826530.1 glutamine-hydrolyzing GMP synthase [Candidatus Adiutrix intracellularis]